MKSRPVGKIWLDDMKSRSVGKIWLDDTESRSVGKIWLDDMESRSVGKIWLDDMESRSVGKIWLDNTEGRSVEKIWLDDTEGRSVGTIWLVCTTWWSCRINLIGWSDLLVLLERSDWMIRLVGPARAIWLDDPTCWSWKSYLIGQYGDLSSGTFDGLLVLQLQTLVCEQQGRDTRNASCFATNLPFNLPLRAK